jgi:hypothetical protein
MILQSLEDDQAVETISIPLAGKTAIADHMVIASGRSTRQVSSMAQKLQQKMKTEFGVLARVEGLVRGLSRAADARCPGRFGHGPWYIDRWLWQQGSSCSQLLLVLRIKWCRERRSRPLEASEVWHSSIPGQLCNERACPVAELDDVRVFRVLDRSTLHCSHDKMWLVDIRRQRADDPAKGKWQRRLDRLDQEPEQVRLGRCAEDPEAECGAQGPQRAQ